jgi:hypothetical protein
MFHRVNVLDFAICTSLAYRRSRHFLDRVRYRNMTTRIAPAVQNEIQLTDAEDRLCTYLDEFTHHLQEKKGITTTCRINGGWVRDKVNPGPLP